MVRARIGLEGALGSSVNTRDVRLSKEDGDWRMSKADLLSLAGATRNKGGNGHSKKKKKV